MTYIHSDLNDVIYNVIKSRYFATPSNKHQFPWSLIYYSVYCSHPRLRTVDGCMPGWERKGEEKGVISCMDIH